MDFLTHTFVSRRPAHQTTTAPTNGSTSPALSTGSFNILQITPPTTTSNSTSLNRRQAVNINTTTTHPSGLSPEDPFASPVEAIADDGDERERDGDEVSSIFTYQAPSFVSSDDSTTRTASIVDRRAEMFSHLRDNNHPSSSQTQQIALLPSLKDGDTWRSFSKIRCKVRLLPKGLLINGQGKKRGVSAAFGAVAGNRKQGKIALSEARKMIEEEMVLEGVIWLTEPQILFVLSPSFPPSLSFIRPPSPSPPTASSLPHHHHSASASTSATPISTTPNPHRVSWNFWSPSSSHSHSKKSSLSGALPSLSLSGATKEFNQNLKDLNLKDLSFGGGRNSLVGGGGGGGGGSLGLGGGVQTDAPTMDARQDRVEKKDLLGKSGSRRPNTSAGEKGDKRKTKGWLRPPTEIQGSPLTALKIPTEHILNIRRVPHRSKDHHHHHHHHRDSSLPPGASLSTSITMTRSGSWQGAGELTAPRVEMDIAIPLHILAASPSPKPKSPFDPAPDLDLISTSTGIGLEGTIAFEFVDILMEKECDDFLNKIKENVGERRWSRMWSGGSGR